MNIWKYIDFATGGMVVELFYLLSTFPEGSYINHYGPALLVFLATIYLVARSAADRLRRGNHRR